MKFLKKVPGIPRAIKVMLFIGAALAAPHARANPAALGTYASQNVDCDQIREKVMRDLNAVRTTNEDILDRCRNTSRTTVEQKDLSACEATYNKINTHTERVENKLGEACKLVREAKEAAQQCATNGQASCLKRLATKDRAAIAKLKEVTNLLKAAEADLKKQQQTNRDVANKYRSVYDNVNRAVAGLPPNATDDQIQSTLTGIDTRSIFGAYAPNAWVAVQTGGLQVRGLTGYDQNWNNAFDDNPTTQPDMQRIDNFSRETSLATTQATQAIKSADVLNQRTERFSQVLEQRASTLTGNSDGLGSIDLNKAASLSTLSGSTRELATAMKGKSGGTGSSTASGGGGGGATSPAAGGASSPAQAGLAAGGGTTPLGGPTGATPVNGEMRNLADNTSHDGSGKDGEEKKDSDTEIAQMFGPIGKVTVGESPELTAERAAVAARARTSGAGGANASGASGRAPASVTAGGESTAANGEGTARVAGGMPALSPAAQAARDKEDAELMKKNPFGADAASLRELLRKRLAERARDGGDAAASMAVDAVLDSVKGPGGAPGAPDGVNSERAGPQAMDSDPLFTRVHNAHHRFQVRQLPHDASL